MIKIDQAEPFEAMRRRLKAINKGDLRMDDDDVVYWSERFVRLHVRFWTGTTFAKYLIDPLYWERIVAAKRERQRRLRGEAHQLIKAMAHGIFRFQIAPN